jgi:diguanylate cyclase (GGDEF)-like protein/PAS domain S-box-containing protein
VHAPEGARWLRSVVENSSEIVKIVDPDGTLRYVNPAFERVLGYDPEEVVGKMNVLDHVHPDDLSHVLEETEKAMAEGGIATNKAEYRFRHKDGSWRWMESIGTYLLEDPAVGGVVVASRDVTERKEAEERYRTLVERVPAAVYVQEIGSPDSAMYMSPRIEDLTGYTPEECKDRDLRWRMVHPEDRGRIQSEDERTGEPGEVFATEYRVLHRDGHTVWVRNESVLVEDEASGSRYWQGFMLDITERKEAEERLEHQALYDHLTDLPNRYLFLDRLVRALELTRRRRGRKAAVLFMDLDEFKVINDSLGHEVGDLLLTVVAQRLRRCLRPEDTLARFGGDEFVVLIEAIADPTQAVRVAERITEQVRRPFILGGRELYVASSIGISLGDVRTHDPDALLREADTAMYRAKDEGGGFRVFDPTMYERALGRLKVENDLRRAIEQEEFVVHYQPIVDPKSGELWGMEALVRWDHPEWGLLEPSEFVPAAEESGIIIPMGEQVLRESCLRAKEWQEENPRIPPLVMSVNLSASQLSRLDLADTVERVLQETGLEGSRLILDVTETAYVKLLAGNTTILDRLRGLGLRFSIDDFGTGYSSLSYLKRLPADAIKVDRSFVKGLGETVEDSAVVRMIIELAHTLGLEVIAEGVETEEQMALLEEMGCDFAQGFLFAQPLPPEDIPGLLSSDIPP